MQVSELIAAGALVPQEMVKKTVTWSHVGLDRKRIKHEFEIHVKRFQSASDFEFVFASRNLDEGVMARRVSRMVRLGEKGEQIIDYDTAREFQPSLLLAFCKAINEVEDADKALEEDKEKK